MLRLTAILTMSLVAVGGAYAGNIAIPVDLTTALVGVGSCSTFNCTPSVSTYNSGTYMNSLFSTTIPTGTPTTSSSPQNVTTGTGTTPFILDAQTASPFNNSYLSSNTANGDTTIVVDLGSYNSSGPNNVSNNTSGIFGIDQVSTMIQANLETSGWQGITITLSGYAANGTTAISDVIQLTSGTDYRGTSSSQAANTIDNGVSHSGGTNSNDSVETYQSQFGGTLSGTTYYLDVQEIDLAALGGTNPFLNGYLDSVSIASVAQNGGKQRIMFSGLTVESATPEPGTVALFGLGLACIAYWKFRKAKVSA